MSAGPNWNRWLWSIWIRQMTAARKYRGIVRMMGDRDRHYLAGMRSSTMISLHRPTHSLQM
jgi:hypothetical protein